MAQACLGLTRRRETDRLARVHRSLTDAAKWTSRIQMIMILIYTSSSSEPFAARGLPSALTGDTKLGMPAELAHGFGTGDGAVLFRDVVDAGAAAGHRTPRGVRGRIDMDRAVGGRRLEPRAGSV